MSYNPCVGGRQTLRASATALSTSFDAAPTSVRISNWNQVTLLITVANFATATSVDIEVDFATPAQGPGGAEIAPAASDWYTRTYTDTAAATASTTTMLIPTRKVQFNFVGNGVYELPFKTMAQYVQVRAKTTLGPGTTTCQIIAVEGMA